MGDNIHPLLNKFLETCFESSVYISIEVGNNSFGTLDETDPKNRPTAGELLEHPFLKLTADELIRLFGEFPIVLV